MKLQKATRFALYAVLELARDPARQLSAAEIAETYGISLNHLAKVMRDLNRAGLVDAVRGARGGYCFSGNAKRTTLMDVIRLYEDLGENPAGRLEPGETTTVGQGLGCVLGEIDDTISATFQSITIDTMLKIIDRQSAS